MQNNFAELTSEAVAVNANLVNKVVNYGIDSSKNLSKEISDQTGKALDAKSVNDFVAVQIEWVEKFVEQSKKSSQTLFEISSEASAAYGSIWQKYADLTIQSVPKPVTSGKKSA